MEQEKLENGTLETWTPQEVSKAMEEGKIILIDVRTPQEYSHERIRGALLMPMQEFEAQFLPSDGTKRVVLHCGSGMRSKRMAEKCLAGKAGTIAHMGGGMSGWKESGLPYIGTDPASGAPKVMSKS